MKKRVLLLVFAVCLSMAVTACGKEQQEDTIGVELLPGEAQTEETVYTTGDVSDEETVAEEPENIGEEIVPEEPGQTRTFDDLATRQFYFSSGAGAWGEEFTIEKDGYFTGKFHDTNMGENGEEYPYGTVYCGSYSGHFKDITKVGEFVYEMKLADISYKKDMGTEEILDGIRYVYTESFFFGDNVAYRIYLPGTPMDEIKEELYWWVEVYNQSESELTMIVLADEKNELAAASVNRMTPSEDAQMTYNTYKESFDYYEEKLTNEAQTTLDMALYAGKLYEVSDECLNYLWNLIRYNIPEDGFSEILSEQRDWIKEKEEKAKEIADAYAGGSLAGTDTNIVLAQLTLERCEKLLGYLQ